MQNEIFLKVSDLRISSLHFAHDVVQCAITSSLHWGRLRMSVKKQLACPLWVRGKLMPQVETCKFLRALLTNEARRIDRSDQNKWISAVMQMLSVVVKTEVRVKKQDLSIDRLGVNETAHTNDQNEFLRKVAGLSLRMRILVNRRSLE